jgi:hypothetical protein
VAVARRPFLLESILENELSQEQAQNLWDQEAAKLDTGDNSPADQNLAAVPDDATDFGTEQFAAEPEKEPDPYAGMSDTVRAKLAQIDQLAEANAQLLHHVKTTEGRVAAMQREAQQARAAQQLVAPQDAPTQGSIATAAKNPEKWEQLKQDFPEWASAMEEYVGSKMGNAGTGQGLTSEQVTGYVQQQVAETRAEMSKLIEEARIEGKHDNWRQTINTTEFAQWYAVQNPDTRALADSPLGRDAIRMLDMYQEAKKVSAVGIRQERNSRLAAAATTRTGQSPPPRTLGDLTPEELWNHEAAQREKTRAQRGY